MSTDEIGRIETEKFGLSETIDMSAESEPQSSIFPAYTARRCPQGH